MRLYHQRMTLGSRLIKLRRAHKRSQDEIGEICGVTKSSVSQWESDSTSPDIAKLLLLREKFEFSLDWLLTGNGVMIGGAYTENERLKCALALMEPLPAYALDHVIQEITETTKLIQKVGMEQAAPSYKLPPPKPTEVSGGSKQKARKVHKR